MPFYEFQETRIMEGENNDPDPSRKPVRIKAMSLERAISALPKTDLGRRWTLISKQDSGKKV